MYVQFGLSSNNGQSNLSFKGVLDEATRCFVGDLNLLSFDIEGNNVCSVRVKPVAVPRSVLVELKERLESWRESYSCSVSLQKLSFDDHRFDLALEPQRAKSGHALFRLIWSTRSFPDCRFSFITDQSCVGNTIDELDRLLRETASS